MISILRRLLYRSRLLKIIYNTKCRDDEMIGS